MSELYLCACEQFYGAHHPDCPAKRQFDDLRETLETENKRLRQEVHDQARARHDLWRAIQSERDALKRIAELDYSRAAVNGAARSANKIAHDALMSTEHGRPDEVDKRVDGQLQGSDAANCNPASAGREQ